MNLKMIVLVKQVPDTHNICGEAMKPDGTVNRDALPAIFNPEDLNALEEALKIKDSYGGHITAISMGPPKAVEVLKECLFRGVDSVVLLSDKGFAGSDTLATSYILTCAIEKVGLPDLIFCGRQAIDGDTAQVGPQVAEKLKVNQLTYVSEIIGIKDKILTAVRLIKNGYQKVQSQMPLLLTVTSAANEPRPCRAKLVMTYKNIQGQKKESVLSSGSEKIAQIPYWDIDYIQADPERCGFTGSATWVKKIENVVLSAVETKQVKPTPEDITTMFQELINEHIIG